MTVCYVCGGELVDEESACSVCGTAVAILDRLGRNSGRQRFLYGRVQPADVPDLPAKAEPVKPPRAKAKPKPVEPDPLEEPLFPNEPDLLPQRDAVAPLVKPRKQRSLVHVLDVCLCMLLDALVFGLILQATSRTLEPLLTYSLIPLLFVLVCFSGLYFWIFTYLFGKTLGSLLMEAKGSLFNRH